MATIDEERRAEVGGRAGRPALQRRLAAFARRSLRAISSGAASSLTRRIVVLNLGGLVALLVGFLYLNQFRESLIESRVQSLLTQGEIIAGAIAASATVETRRDHHRSRQAAPAAGGRERRDRRGSARFLDQSRKGRAAAAPAGHADQDAGPHL
jgi:hypothetical protein